MESMRTANPFLSGKSSSTGGIESLMPFENIPTGAIIAIVAVSFIVALLIFTLLVERKKAPRSKFLSWLREYLNFRSILIGGLIKFVYLFATILLTVFGIVTMCSGRDEMVLPMLGVGLAIVVLGNILLRLLLELTMMIIGMWENTSDMRAVLVRDDEKPEEKAPKKSAGKPVEKPAEKPVEKPVTAQVVETADAPAPEPATAPVSEQTVAPVVKPVNPLVDEPVAPSEPKA